jgi:hypothetical protein
VGGETPAITLLNAVEILYRKLIRDQLKIDPELSSPLALLCKGMGRRVAAPAAVLIQRCLRTITKTREVSVPDDKDKKGLKTKIVTVPYRVYDRPTLDSGVALAEEVAFVTNYNNCVAKIEQEDSRMNLDCYKSYSDWENKAKQLATQYYNVTKEVVQVFKDRKSKLRTIIGENRKTIAATQHRVLSDDEYYAPASATEFTAAKESLFSGPDRQTFLDIFETSVTNLLGSETPKDLRSEQIVRDRLLKGLFE